MQLSGFFLIPILLFPFVDLFIKVSMGYADIPRIQKPVTLRMLLPLLKFILTMALLDQGYINSIPILYQVYVEN